MIEIALICGFSTPAAFAKSFKTHFKMSATQWRERTDTSFHDNSFHTEAGILSIVNNSPVWKFQKTGRQVQLEVIPPLKVGYIRFVGPYQGKEALFDDLYGRLFQWAVPRGYLSDDTVMLNLYHDNPEITENRNLRVMTAITIPNKVSYSDTVGITTLSGGTYAVCRLQLKKNEFVAAWEWMFSVWLANSGYELDDRELFERILGKHEKGNVRIFDVDICVPVKSK